MNVSYQVEKTIGKEKFIFQRGYDRYEKRVKVEVRHWRFSSWPGVKGGWEWSYYGTWDTVKEATEEIEYNEKRGCFDR